MSLFNLGKRIFLLDSSAQADAYRDRFVRIRAHGHQARYGATARPCSEVVGTCPKGTIASNSPFEAIDVQAFPLTLPIGLVLSRGTRGPLAVRVSHPAKQPRKCRRLKPGN